MRINELSFRSGKEAIAKHSEVLASIFAAIVNAQEAQLKRPRVSIEKHLRRELLAEDWKSHKNLSLLKKRVVLHTELSFYEFVYRDLLQLLVAHSAGKIDAGVIIANTTNGSRRVKHKSAKPHFERICKELKWLYPALPVPIWVIGLK